MRRLLFATVTATALLAACQGILGIKKGTPRGTGGGAGTGGLPDASGTGGAAGSGGNAGASGTGGTAGSSGTAGSGNTGGVAGGAGADAGPPNGCSANPSKCILPPARSAAANNTGGTDLVIELHHMFLGDTDRNGNASASAWQEFGYNLDGLISTANDTNHCAPVAATTVKNDGPGGLDNSFGENVMPELITLSPGAGTQTSQAIQNGLFNDLISIHNAKDFSASPDQNGLTGALFVGAPLTPAPAFNGSDQWAVTNESVNNGDINQPLVAWPDSYVSGGTWVSGSKVDLTLPLRVSNYTMQLPIHGAVITMRLQGTTQAVDGIIAGQIATDDLVNALKLAAGSIDGSLCDSTAFDTEAQKIRAASDIMVDGTNGDPSKTCNAISIGLGFDGVVSSLGGVAAPAAPPGDSCDFCQPFGATDCHQLQYGNAGNTACDNCVETQCCSQINACLTDTDCNDFLGCVSNACASAQDPTTCIQQHCISCNTSTAQTLGDAMNSCISNALSTNCQGICP